MFSLYSWFALFITGVLWLNFYHFSIYWSSLFWMWIIFSCLVAWLVIFDGIPNVNFMLLGAGFCCISLNSFICHITKWCVIVGSFSNFPLRFGRMIANGMPSWLVWITWSLHVCYWGQKYLQSFVRSRNFGLTTF